MAITAPVNLTPAEEAALVTRAEAEGISVDAFLRRGMLWLISATASAEPASLRAEERKKDVGERLDCMPDLPSLSDDAIIRESVYTREDEWR